MNAPEQAIKIYRGDDTDWNGETLLNFTVTADFDISDFTAEFLLGGISKKNISLADGGNFEVNFSHEETAQMPWGLNKGILKIFDADKRIKTVTNDILFWVTNEPVGEQTESIIVPVPETSPVQITLQIGGGSSGGGAWGSITGNIENQADLQAEFAEVQSQINAIDGLIPAQATEENKLADKNFVNSSISTNTAYFIGTFESVEALEAYSGTVTNNDYAFVVGTDSDGNTVYNRYKYTTATTPASWLFEYALNNSSFTAAQWAAIQSGITSADVTQIGTNTNNISTLQSDKQPKTLATPITVDGTQQTTVEGALGAVNTLAGKGLANKATGTNSLTILGTATTTSNSINIGASSKAVSHSGQVAIGNSAWSQGSSATALCSQASALDNNAIAIGAYCTASKPSSIAIGGDSTPAMATKNSAIQLGAGTNNTANSLQVFSYQLLDGSTGKIPAERLDNALPSQTDQSGKFLTTNGTAASWATVESLPSQSGQSGKYLTTDGTSASWGSVDALKNLNSYSSSLTILGSATPKARVVQIGKNSYASEQDNTVVGYQSGAQNEQNVVVGSQCVTNSAKGAVAVGYLNQATGNYSISIGRLTKATAENAIQLGSNGSSGTTNSTAKTLQVFEHQLLDGNTGKIPTARLNSTEVSAMGMPSGRYEALTLGNSGDSYTAPGNGYFYMYVPTGSSGNNQLIYIENVGKPCVSTTAPGTLTGIACTLPVLSGDTVKIYYVRQGTSSTLRFYYADGNPGGN